jgi:malate permease and related proteins
MHVVNSLAPIFLLVALGTALKSSGFFDASFFKNLTRFTFWFALPALLIDKIAAGDWVGATLFRGALLLLIVSLICVALARAAAVPLRVPSASLGAFLQGSFRSNIAFIGLPVILYALADGGPGLETVAVVTVALTTIWYNVFGILVLAFSRPRAGRLIAHLARSSRDALLNPLMIACLAGFLLRALPWDLPVAARRSLGALGQAALPLALLTVGARLSLAPLRHSAGPAVVAALLKTVLCPALGWWIGPRIGLTGPPLAAALIFLGCPTAVTSYIMADMMGHDGELAGQIVVVSTLMSAATLTTLLALGI